MEDRMTVKPAQRKLKFSKPSQEPVKYFYKCPHCYGVSYQWAPPGRRTLVCEFWRCAKRFWTYQGLATEDDWGRYTYGTKLKDSEGNPVSWRKLHAADVKRATEYWNAWVKKDKQRQEQKRNKAKKESK